MVHSQREINTRRSKKQCVALGEKENNSGHTQNAVCASRAAWPLTRPPVHRTSGKAGGRPHHPQAHIGVAIVGRVVEAIRRAPEALDKVPGPATHHPAGTGWTRSFTTICSV